MRCFHWGVGTHVRELYGHTTVFRAAPSKFALPPVWAAASRGEGACLPRVCGGCSCPLPCPLICAFPNPTTRPLSLPPSNLKGRDILCHAPPQTLWAIL